MQFILKHNPYVVLDRDGTLIDLIDHLSNLNQVSIKGDAVKSLNNLLDSGFKLGIISNQSVIGRGLATSDQVEKINMYISNYFSKFKINFEFFLICPHTPKNKCDCRKPKEGLGLAAMRKYGFSSGECYYIGDKCSDMEFAHNLGWKGVQIISDSIPSELAHFHTSSLFEASKWVVSNYEVIYPGGNHNK